VRNTVVNIRGKADTSFSDVFCDVIRTAFGILANHSYAVFGKKLSRHWPDILGSPVLGRWSTLRIRGSHEQSLRTGSFPQARIEADDGRRLGVERGRQMQRVKSAEGGGERQHQPLGTAMDRWRQLGMMRRRVKL
jgi:hypothetical protein